MDKTLVLTDNVGIYNRFVGLEEIKPYLNNMVFASSPGNDIGQLEHLSVKSDISEIAENYQKIISLHCQQIFPAELVDSVNCVNVHPGYNPYNRGVYSQVFSILNQKPCGATIHRIDAELDHGKIIIQKEVPILDWDNSGTVYDRILNTEMELLANNIERILLNDYDELAMKGEGNLNTKKDFSKLCQLDMNSIGTINQHIDLLRALTHGEYANAYYVDENNQKISVKIQLTLIDNNTFPEKELDLEKEIGLKDFIDLITSQKDRYYVFKNGRKISAEGYKTEV